MSLRARGLALPMVLMVSMVILGVMMVGLGFASQNTLFVAGLDRREAARYAAEAGAYRMLAHLESQPSFAGGLEGTLDRSGASFEVTMSQNDLAGASGFAIVRSKGRCGRFTSTLEVKVQRSGESFEAVGSEGLVRTEGNVFANGLKGLKDPRPEAAQVRSNSSADRSVDATGRFLVRGTVSSAGGIGSGVRADSLLAGSGTSPLGKVDRDKLLARDFTTGSLPADGVIASNLRVVGDAVFRGTLRLQNGAVLHVKDGDLVVRGGVTGNGAVLADGDLRLRGSADLDVENTEGVTLFGQTGVEIAHPSATHNGDTYEVQADPVAEWFAAMPEEARYLLSESLPPGAPTGIGFFEWYHQQRAAPDATFQAWREGSGPMAPGLPTEVRDWLDASAPLMGQLKAWAASNGPQQ